MRVVLFGGILAAVSSGARGVGGCPLGGVAGASSPYPSTASFSRVPFVTLSIALELDSSIAEREDPPGSRPIRV